MTTSATSINLAAQSKPKIKTQARRTQAQWKALLEEYDACDLTQAAFCKKHQIASSSLWKWRKHFSSEPADKEFIDITESLINTPSSYNSARDGRWQVELELAPGVMLRIRSN